MLTEIPRIDFICLKRSHRFLTFESGGNECYGLQGEVAKLMPEVKMEELEDLNISESSPVVVTVGGI
ncbi:hypothetical protein BUQ74_02325 [Leptospira weilii serovar Heyan]|nr:hypothetical protein BUQ74_02325 [Leptospira weilii serovar Heyan]QDK24703.1 hypothetical protein FHG67_05800 [Leptospira weilii]QDK28655.1 hypothetical protein FHG68_05715 [Leptospira weilii]